MSRDTVTWYVAENRDISQPSCTPRSCGYDKSTYSSVDSVLSVPRRGLRRGWSVLLATTEVDRVSQQISRFSIDLASIYRLLVIESSYKSQQRVSITSSNYRLLITMLLQHVFRPLSYHT